jgi:hypothetical protein
MTTRTFKQYGQGYGTTPATIVVTLDGVMAFNGDIATLDQPLPYMPIAPGTNVGVELYSWTKDLAFQGTDSLQITVSDGTLLLAKSVANYFKYPVPASPSGPYQSSGPDNFVAFYYYTVDGDIIADCLSNVSIDGVAQTSTRVEGEIGQWYWVLAPGQTLTATINVLAGYESDNIWPPPAP